MEDENLEGTIRINGVLHKTTPPWGCSSLLPVAANRLKSDTVAHSQNSKVIWLCRFEKGCVHKMLVPDDSRCAGCTHPAAVMEE